MAVGDGEKRRHNLCEYVLWYIFAKNVSAGKMGVGVCSLCAVEIKV